MQIRPTFRMSDGGDLTLSIFSLLLSDHRSDATDHRSDATDQRSDATDHRSDATDHRDLTLQITEI